MSLFSALSDKAAGLANQLASKAKAAARNISELELKVEQATNNDAWGPHGQAMADIAQAALDVEKFNMIMGVVEQRLLDKDENWRHVYKSLLLLEYLLRHGPLRIVEYLTQNKDALEHLSERFEYRDPNGKDQGINVRQRAKELIALVNDPDRVRTERERAAKNIGKYTGVSSTDFRTNRTPSSTASPQPTDRMTAPPAYSSPAPAFKGNTAGEEDPFEATRKRIQALKMEGAIPDGPLSPVKPVEEPEATKKIKKLSEVAVDPSITAKLGGFPVLSAPASSGRGRTAPPSSAANLLADFDAASPSPTTAKPAIPAEWTAFEGPFSKQTGASSAATSAAGWDAFGSQGPIPAAPTLVPTPAPKPAAAAAVDDWSGFASASAASKTQAPRSTNIEAMLNIGSAPAPTGGPLPLEAFSSIPAGPPPGVRPPSVRPPGPMPFDAFAAAPPPRPMGAGRGGPFPMDAFSAFPAQPMPRPAGPMHVQPGFNPGGFGNAGMMQMGPTPGFAGCPGGQLPGLAAPFNDPFGDPFGAPVSSAPMMQTMPMTFSTTGKVPPSDKPKIGPEAAAAAKKKDPFSDLLSM